MKKTIFLLFFLAIAQISFAQSDSVRFQISISNPSAISHYTTGGLPVFSSSSINSILASYNITEFRQAYPTSRMQYLRKVYSVRCNSIALAAALKAANPALFPAYSETGATQTFAAFYPNDWAIYPNANLDYIGAPDAWGLTQGDPDVIIGITDTYFDEAHPDFVNTGGASKIANVSSNVLPPTSKGVDYIGHGTLVAGLIAAATHNAKGYPAIGFNCRLDINSADFDNPTINDNEILKMSQRGVGIFNGSWGYTKMASKPLDLRNYFVGQGIYNEIYENGMFACFAAGNGGTSGADFFNVPASYDHNFSVTNVGYDKTPSPSNPAYNLFDVFEQYKGSTGGTNFQHNSRIDICAPALSINGLWYDYTNPSKHYFTDYGIGTSLASPLVAGTAGLIQSALKLKDYPKFKDAKYSPYQLEYIIKNEAKKSILTKTENLPYAGQLGAGALNARQAVEGVFAGRYDPNSANTQTMYIKGIEINTICVPGNSSNGVKPKLKPILANGTGISYVWEPVPGENSVELDNENIAEPTIINAWPPYICYYRLTVYDNSTPAQKVAMKTFKIQLKTSGYDLAMRDSYIDMLNEPNDQRMFDPRDIDTWTSQDIWNRQYADAGLEHQNPEYFSSDPNHVYTRVRNVGCIASPSTAKLRLYWTKSSTGEDWDEDWKTTNVPAAPGVPGGTMPGGREITTGSGIALPVLQPGDATIIHQNWYPEKPEDYAGSPSSFDACLLARIEENATYPHGMTIAEKFKLTGVDYTGVGENIRNNNNIVTRNMVLTNLNPFNIKSVKRQLIVANGNATATTYNFEFASERSIFRHFAGDFSSLGSVTLHLGNLYDAWVASGSHGTVASSNAQNRTVTFDGANTLRLDSIPFAANQRYTIDVEFRLDSPVVVNEVSNHIFHARQFDVATPDEVYGAVNYQVTVSPPQNNQRKALEEGVGSIESFNISPNPTTGILRISYIGDKENASEIIVSDMAGKKIMSEKANFKQGSTKEINLSRFAAGVYLINISNTQGKSEVYKVVKE